MKYLTTLTISFSILFSMNGCAALKQIEETKKTIMTCKFTLQSIKPSIDITKPKLSLKGIKGASVKIVFDLVIDITNTTDMDLSMNKFDLNVYVDNKRVATGTTSQYVLIPVGETASLPAKVSVDPQSATNKLVKKLKGKDVDYRVVGVFYFKIKNWDIPIPITLKEG